jgi:hypothetical protein
MVLISMKTAPARETVQVSCLPKNVNVEISMIATYISIITEQLFVCSYWHIVNIAYAKQHVYIYFMSMTPMDL